MSRLRLAAAQTLEYREDVEGALSCIADLACRAETEGARLLCFPEGFLLGYMTGESSARRVALDIASDAFEQILRRLPPTGPMLVIGIIERSGDRLFNSAVVIERGVVLGCYRKRHLLPGEKVFDVGEDMPIFAVDGLRFGINICHDTAFPEPARLAADLGANLIVCPANNMMMRDKAEIFRSLHNQARGDRCRETGLWLISADVTGEREGRVSWGPTALLNPAGEVVAQLPLGEPGLLVVDIP